MNEIEFQEALEVVRENRVIEECAIGCGKILSGQVLEYKLRTDKSWQKRCVNCHKYELKKPTRK